MLEDTTRADAVDVARTRAAVRGLALLNAQADALRTQLRQLREELLETQREANAERSLLIVQANEQLVLAALRAEGIAEAAKSNFDELAISAQRDALTGLPNRALMLDRMQTAIARTGRRELSFAVLFIDLDHFKRINDTFGHAIGDAVLKQVARRLESAVRATDTVSRHGGDEFVVLLAELSSDADLGAVASKLLCELQAPLELEGGPSRISASIGISLYPTDGSDAATLVALADVAMYAAKRAGGGRHVFQGELGTGDSPGALWTDAPRPGEDIRADVVKSRVLLTKAGVHHGGLHSEHVTFLAMVAHELRNPLAPLRHAATLLTTAGTHEDGLAKLQGVIQRQVSRMTRLIDDLLHISREGVSKFHLEYDDVDLAQLFATVLEACHPSIAGRRQRIETRFPARWPSLRGDAVRLAQVFGNLIDNASRYTPDEGDLTLAVTLKPPMIEVVVSDTGVGISAGAVQHIFNLFVREDRRPQMRSDGLGIGLAVVREIVHLHGGTVTAHSDGHNLGSSFRVLLPLTHHTATNGAVFSPGATNGAVSSPGATNGATPLPGTTPGIAPAADKPG